MSAFYKVLFRENPRFGAAFREDDKSLFELPDGNVTEWNPPRLELRDGGFPDYLGSDMGCRLCSEKLKVVISDGATEDDVLQWLPTTVRRGAEKRTYYILHFPAPPDLLDKARTLYAGGSFVVKAVLDKKVAARYAAVSYPGAGKHQWFVSAKLKRAIQSAKCTGMELSPAPTN